MSMMKRMQAIRERAKAKKNERKVGKNFLRRGE